MDLSLSTIEKQAIARILIDLASADEIITDEETAFMYAVSETLEISLEVVKSSHKMSVTHCLSILRGLDETQKEGVSILMLGMMSADGEIDKSEIALFAIVCAGADIPLPKFD